jgi:hypothetical protein
MSVNRRAPTTVATSTSSDRARVGLLTLALAVSWASMLFHNQELPLTLLDVENTGPLAFDVALLVVCWWWPSSRVVWTAILVWGVVNMVIGGILTVLPLPVLPFSPAQTVEHYAVHAVYAIGQLPLVLVAGRALRQLRQKKQHNGANGGHDDSAGG